MIPSSTVHLYMDLVSQVKGLPANQGMLYKQALEDQFRNVGFNPEAVFEETRSA